MRHAILILAGLATLGGCSDADRDQVSATPPTVSYRVAGDDISQANVSAAQYCGRYNRSAQYQGLQSTPTGNVAVYSCAGAITAGSGSSGPPPAYPPPAPPPYAEPQIECATPFHQDLPGGTDYSGPPVTGCPTPQY